MCEPLKGRRRLVLAVVVGILFFVPFVALAVRMPLGQWHQALVALLTGVGVAIGYGVKVWKGTIR